MEAHFVVAEGPIVARTGISLGHDAVNPYGFQSGSQGDGPATNKGDQRPVMPWNGLSGDLDVWTYAFPPPIINTSVSISGESSSFLPGDWSRDSFSGCRSRSSSFVLRIQIFHWISSSSSFLTGKSKALPLHVAAGELVLKLSEQSMNCLIAGKKKRISYAPATV